MPECQIAFLSILVYFYERLQKEYNGEVKKVPSPTIDKETEIYRNSQDTINRFISEMVVVCPENDHADVLGEYPPVYPLSNVADLYIIWYDSNINKLKRHVATEIIKEFENSSLRKKFHREANQTLVLQGCRILGGRGGKIGLRLGEEYFSIIKNAREGYITEDQLNCAREERKKRNSESWWIPIPRKKKEKSKIDTDNEWVFLPNNDDQQLQMSETRERRKKKENNGFGKYLDDILNEDSANFPVVYTYGPEDIYDS